MSYDEIPWLYAGSDCDRARLHRYCLRDAELPARIDAKLRTFEGLVQMSRVCYVSLMYLLEKGQQVKVIAQLLVVTREQGYLVPSFPPRPFTDDASTKRAGREEKAYEGAKVIDPKRGFYQMPVVTLDFSSLYPSIMISHNLCYTTLVRPGDHTRLAATGVPLHQTPAGHWFVDESHRTGLLPTMLKRLLTNRKAAKVAMATATDAASRSVYDGRQLALKISANSVYGFTGATIGKLPALPVSESVTAYGRQAIERTRSEVNTRYHDTDVVYGDTDSVMVAWAGGASLPVHEVLERGKEMATFVNQFFGGVMRIEFEKVLWPFLLLAKKRYAGQHWERAERPEFVNVKGLESARRDNSPFLVEVQSTVLSMIIERNDVDGAARFIVTSLADLRAGRVPIEKLIMSKNFSRPEDEYAAAQPHVTVIRKVRKRNPAAEPHVGDRVNYVIVNGAMADTLSTCQRAEDPAYVMQHRDTVLIDYVYYADKVCDCLRRMLEPVYGAQLERLLQPGADSMHSFLPEERQAQLRAERGDDGSHLGSHLAAEARRLKSARQQQEQVADQAVAGLAPSRAPSSTTRNGPTASERAKAHTRPITDVFRPSSSSSPPCPVSNGKK